MKTLGFSLILLFVITSCAGIRLTMQDAGFRPEVVSPGDDALILVKIEDSRGVVAKVKATLRQDREYNTDLNDRGKNGDEAAGDGLWSSSFHVPWDAPADVYDWDFEAFTDNGDPVRIATEDGGKIPLTAEASVEVK